VWPRSGHLLSGALGREQIGVEFDDSVVSGVRWFEEER
jgi:hypothetical protein